MDPINLFDYESAARDKLPQMAFDYYAGGSDDEITLRDNREAYSRITLRYRVLRDISGRDLSTSIFGQEVSMPILVAPTAFHRLACEEGELATARGADRTGTILILSTLSTTAMEEVRAVAGGPAWFQLYFYRDREATADLVRRAEAAGYTAIVLTVDAQLWGVRERDVRNRFQLLEGLSMPNLRGDMSRLGAADADSGLAAYVAEMFDPELSWEHVEWLASLTDLPVLIKGVVHAADACLAIEHGAAGVIVSNHGGRQLDTSVATISALPEVTEAAREALARDSRESAEFSVLLDGGIRRGTDVVKALAMGADAVCVGRPILWGLAVDGEDGVVRVLELLRAETDTAMGLCGATSPHELREMGPDLIVRPGGF
jgi:4-hydroxymandelate oxidase